MSDDLEGNLARNEAMWSVWLNEGVTESTPLDVDFHFYATSEAAANALARALRDSGVDKVEAHTTRTLWIFKGWTVEATEHGTWSLEKLQQQTRVFCRLAASHRCRLEGCGAMMPGRNGAEPGAPTNGGPTESIADSAASGGRHR